MGEDIRPIIKGWSYRPGRISVRRIIGDDGKPKIQMRLDLGLMQMEPTGRPDGTRPKGYESLLEYYNERLERYRQRHETDMGFELSPEDCAALREEALTYYHRHLACFILEDYQQVIRDTQRNVRVFDLCRQYAVRRSDRMILEQYRPYIIMMNARAKAHQAAGANNYAEALKIVKTGLRSIKKIYVDLDQREEFGNSEEASVLRHLGRRIQRQLPRNPVKLLEKKLERAIQEERFEDAARLKDRIDRITNRPPEDQDHTG